MPYTASSAFWTSGVPLRDLEITLPLPHSDELPLGLALHAFSPGAVAAEGEPPHPPQQFVLISGLAPGSVAEKQLRSGDILRSINGAAVGGDVSVAEGLIASAPGVLRLHVLRPMNAGPAPPALAAFEDTGFSGPASLDACDGVAAAGGVRSELELVAASYLMGRSSRRPSSSLEEERLSGPDRVARRRHSVELPRGDVSPLTGRLSSATVDGACCARAASAESTDAPSAGGDVPAGVQAEEDGVEAPPPLYFALLETFGG